MSLGSCLVRTATAFSDLGETGMSIGAGVIGGDRRLKLLFGLGNQALGEIVMAELSILGGLLSRRERGHAHCTHLVELERGLTERCFGVSPADSLEGREVR